MDNILKTLDHMRTLHLRVPIEERKNNIAEIVVMCEDCGYIGRNPEYDRHSPGKPKKPLKPTEWSCQICNSKNIYAGTQVGLIFIEDRRD